MTITNTETNNGIKTHYDSQLKIIHGNSDNNIFSLGDVIMVVDKIDYTPDIRFVTRSPHIRDVNDINRNDLISGLDIESRLKILNKLHPGSQERLDVLEYIRYNICTEMIPCMVNTFTDMSDQDIKNRLKLFDRMILVTKTMLYIC